MGLDGVLSLIDLLFDALHHCWSKTRSALYQKATDSSRMVAVKFVVLEV